MRKIARQSSVDLTSVLRSTYERQTIDTRQRVQVVTHACPPSLNLWSKPPVAHRDIDLRGQRQTTADLFFIFNPGVRLVESDAVRWMPGERIWRNACLAKLHRATIYLTGLPFSVTTPVR